MRYLFQLFVFIGFLFLHGFALAMQPLPLAQGAAANAAIGEPLKGLLEDYVKLLPVQTSLQITEPDQGYLTHSWSKNYDALQKNCRAQSGVCAGILAAQFDILLAELNKELGAASGQSDGLRVALLFSAEADLCLITTGMSAMGGRCTSPNLLTRASYAWQQLGYDHLFIEYFDRDEGNRRQFLDWLATQSNLSAEEKAYSQKQWDTGIGGMIRGALAFEMRDKLSAAYSSWLMVLLQQINLKDQQAMLGALGNLARIAAIRGRHDDAEQWWTASQALLAENPELQGKSLCTMQSVRMVMDATDSAHISDPEMPGRFQQLIAQGCSYTEPSILFAFQTMKQGGVQMAQTILGMAKAACERDGDCSHDRKLLIDKLWGITRGDVVGMRAEAQEWQAAMKKFRIPLRWERSLIWTLADKLYASGATADATSLYHALDESIEFERNQVMFNDPSDWARYDELKRMRVRSDLEQGITALPEQAESLRSQGLLKRLRGKRWMKELVGQADAADKAEYERQQNDLNNARQTIIQAMPGLPGSFRVIAQAMLDDMGKTAATNEEIYLDRLAKKKQGATGWLEFGGLDRYQREQKSETIGQEYPLGEEAAYLSWLKVPGGYAATLLVPRPWERMGKLGDTTYFIPNANLHVAMQQQFIAFSPQDEAVLRLYRDLLQSGASVERGFKRTQPLEGDAEGLRLNGVPVWQLADGSFSSSQVAPANAHRVKNLAELGDALYQRLLAPFATAYQDAQRLIISPDGELAYLPFETLTRKGVPVLETVDIGYVQSLAVYAELKKRMAGKKRQASASLLSVADPQYQLGAAGAATEPQGKLERIQWPALPGTRKESAAITALYRKNRQMLGAEASKANLAKMGTSLADYQVLHFATHGYVDDERSALVLSPEKGALSAYLRDQDIAGWKLDSDLVLLSACNTGIGRKQTGEGIVGLPYAFFMAGNINTLMSLWPVDDEGTAKLMPAYMQRIQQGEDHVTALNNTKRAFARGDYGPAFKNPRIWAAFVLYGVPVARQ